MAEHDALGRGMELLARAVETNSERLAGVEQQLAQLVAALAPREGQGDPLHDALQRIVALLEAQGETMDRHDGLLHAILRALRPGGAASP